MSSTKTVRRSGRPEALVTSKHYSERMPNDLSSSSIQESDKDDKDSITSKDSQHCDIPQLRVNSLMTVRLEELPSPLPPDYNEGKHKFQQLSWPRLMSCLICEAIALGALSLPKAFATLGMLFGLLATIGMGLVSVYTAMIIGEVQLRNPSLRDYAEIGRRLFGKPGYTVLATMLVLLLVLTTGSHVLTGVIAFKALSTHSICAVSLGVISAAVLFILGLPTTFHNMAILAYTDFASITVAVIVTIAITAVESSHQVGGIAATEWYWVLPKDKRPDFVEGMLAITNLALAYAYAQSFPSFMAELRRPEDYKKAIWSLGAFQIAFYTLTGSIIYVFKGTNIASPALLSIEPRMQKVVFALALPVIFISGSINSQTASKFIYELIYPIDSPHRYINTRKGLLTWVGLGLVLTFVAFLSAEAIPSFSTFLGLIAALFTACFSFTLPAIMYFKIVRYQAPRCETRWIRLTESVANTLIFALGAFIMFAGCAACVISLMREFQKGVSLPFSC